VAALTLPNTSRDCRQSRSEKSGFHPAQSAAPSLSSAGFATVNVQQQSSGDVPNGTVISVDPPAGTQVPPNQAITLVVSSGQERVGVPNVEGLNEANARTQLEAAGLSVSVSQEDVSNPRQDGRVLRQSPSAGRQVDRGSTVHIVVARFSVTGGGGGGGGGGN